MRHAMNGLIGKKLGMTRVYDEQGQQVPVTVIEAGPCVVVQRKNLGRDGYEAVQLGYGDMKESRLSKPMTGHFKKAQAPGKRWLCEFTATASDDLKEGALVTVEIFEKTPYVDVSGVSKGKGFQGVVRRHRMGGGPITHGGHSKRRIGAIAQRAVPGNVAKDHHMPGHMGNEAVTVQNLKVVAVRKDDNLVLVQGAVPGPTGAMVIVRKALKKGSRKES